MRLAPAGQTERQNVLRTLDKLALQQRGQQPPNFGRQDLFIEVAQGLALRQPGLVEQSLYLAFAPILLLALAQVLEQALVAPVLALGSPDALLPDRCHGRQ